MSYTARLAWPCLGSASTSTLASISERCVFDSLRIEVEFVRGSKRVEGEESRGAGGW